MNAERVADSLGPSKAGVRTADRTESRPRTDRGEPNTDERVVIISNSSSRQPRKCQPYLLRVAVADMEGGGGGGRKQDGAGTVRLGSGSNQSNPIQLFSHTPSARRSHRPPGRPSVLCSGVPINPG